MTIAINQQPQLYTPVYNQVLILAESDKTAETDFRLRVEIFQDRDLLPTGSLIYTGFFLPRPNTIEAVIDVHRICETVIEESLIEDLVNQNLGTQGHGFQNHRDLTSFSIVITEEYGSPRADDDVATVQFFGFNSALKEQDFVDWDHTNYLLVLNDATKLFLTNAPDQDVEIADSAILSWLQTEDGGGGDIVVDVIEVETFNDTGSLIQTATIAAGLVDSLGTDWSDFNRSLMVGPDDLNNTTLATGSQPLIDSDTVLYTVQCIDDNGDASSELKTYNVVDFCDRATPRRLYWLNKLSGFDSFTFELESIESVEVDRKTTNRTGYLFDGVLTNLQKESGKISYNIEYRDRMRLTSNWMSTEQMSWLEELVTATEIFMFKDGKFHSILITNQPKYEKKTTERDKVFNLILEVEFAYKSFSQRA